MMSLVIEAKLSSDWKPSRIGDFFYIPSAHMLQSAVFRILCFQKRLQLLLFERLWCYAIYTLAIKL